MHLRLVFKLETVSSITFDTILLCLSVHYYYLFDALPSTFTWPFICILNTILCSFSQWQHLLVQRFVLAPFYAEMWMAFLLFLLLVNFLFLPLRYFPFMWERCLCLIVILKYNPFTCLLTINEYFSSSSVFLYKLAKHLILTFPS